MAVYFSDIFDEIKIPWNCPRKECQEILQDAGIYEPEKGPESLSFENEYNDTLYEVRLAFPESAHGTLRAATITLKNNLPEISRTKNAIRNFRLAYKLLKKRLGDPLEVNEFDPDDEPVALLSCLKNEDYPEAIWGSRAERIHLEISPPSPFQTVVRHFCQLPVEEPQRRVVPPDILSMIQNLDITVEKIVDRKKQ